MIQYDDDYDDEYPSIEKRGADRGRYSRETSAKAAASGLTFSVIALGLLVVSFVVWVLAVSAAQQQRLGGGNEAPFYLVSLVVVLASFVLALMAIVFSNRGLDANNNYNRGQATAGLVCGIIGLVLSSLSGLLYMCIGIFIFAAHGG